MTKKIALINQKGGVGKSTFTDELAFQLKDRGLSVYVSDLDDQQSTFFENEETEEDPDVILVDTRGSIDLSVSSAGAMHLTDIIKDVDLVVIPTLPQRDSVEPTGRVAAMCEAHNTNYLIVFNQLELRKLVHQNIYQEISTNHPGKIARTSISPTTIVEKARDCYVPVSTFGKNTKAFQQFNSLASEILER